MTEATDTTATPAATPTTAKKTHFGGREHRIGQLKSLAVKVEAATEVFKDTPASEAILDAKDALNEAIELANSLPADWKPAGSQAAAKAKFEPTVGSLVQLRANKIEKYVAAGLMTKEELSALTVAAIVGKKARCSAATGVVIIVPISQLRSRK